MPPGNLSSSASFPIQEMQQFARGALENPSGGQLSLDASKVSEWQGCRNGGFQSLARGYRQENLLLLLLLLLIIIIHCNLPQLNLPQLNREQPLLVALSPMGATAHVNSSFMSLRTKGAPRLHQPTSRAGTARS